eukprot:COSAG02_NODE_1512_length_12212_cov_4.145133_1_plen_119_part_00
MMLKTANDLFDRIVSGLPCHGVLTAPGTRATLYIENHSTSMPLNGIFDMRIAVLFGWQGNGETYNSTHWLFWFGCRCDRTVCRGAVQLSFWVAAGPLTRLSSMWLLNFRVAYRDPCSS